MRLAEISSSYWNWVGEDEFIQTFWTILMMTFSGSRSVYVICPLSQDKLIKRMFYPGHFLCTTITLWRLHTLLTETWMLHSMLFYLQHLYLAWHRTELTNLWRVSKANKQTNNKVSWAANNDTALSELLNQQRGREPGATSHSCL